MGTTWAAAVVEVLRAQAQAYRVLETVVSKKTRYSIARNKTFCSIRKMV